MRVLIALILVVCAGPALAQSLASLSAQDQQAIQYSLEFEQTNAQVTLPSGARFTIVRTETRPQICRYFEVSGGQGTQQGVGCRTGNRQWELRPTGTAVSAQPTRPIFAVPRPPRDGDSAPPVAAQPTTVASLPGQSGAPTVSVAPPVGGVATTVVVPRTPQPVAPPAGHTPTPAVIAPAVTAPVPAAIGVAAVDPDDFPRPARRPGDVVPLSAAPAQMRAVPMPAHPPRGVAAGTPVAVQPAVAEVATDGPATDGPATDQPATDQPATDGEPLSASAEDGGWSDEQVAEMRAESRQVLASPPVVPLPVRPPGRAPAPVQVVDADLSSDPDQVAELGDETIIFFEEQGDAAVGADPGSVATAPLSDAPVPNAQVHDAPVADSPVADSPVPAPPPRGGDGPNGDAQAVASLLDQFRASDDGSVPPADQLPRQTNLVGETAAPEPPDGAVAAVVPSGDPPPFEVPLPPRIFRAPTSGQLPQAAGGDRIPTPRHRPVPPS
ncbi:MAG: hypothetical protein H6843_00175 [Rhodospirillaceae bacterium]|nr:hypothetical protein [Rhodospirillaceae bacterium]